MSCSDDLSRKQTNDLLRVYLREVEQRGASPSGSELAECVVFAGYYRDRPARGR